MPAGRRPLPVVMSLVRELTPDDLARLSLRPPAQPPTLQKLRAKHHRQAQLLAEGRTLTEVAALCGTTPGRLSILQDDPTFADLVAYYSDQQAEIEFETHKRIQETLVDVLEMAADEMQERLSDDKTRKGMSIGDLRKVAEFAADRTVAPPRASQQGSGLPPARIELNFGWTPSTPVEVNTPKVIEGEKLNSKLDSRLDSSKLDSSN